MYERYLADPKCVDAAWHDFFADYRPAKPANANGTTSAPASATTPTPATATPAPAEPAQSTPAAPATSAAPAAAPASAPASAPATAKPAAATAAPVHPQGAPVTDQTRTLRGAAARVVTNMETS